MKKLFFLICIVAFPFFLHGQNVEQTGKKSKNYVSSEYNRNSLTIINLGFPGPYSSNITDLVQKTVPPDKFFNNIIDVSSIPFSGVLNLNNLKTQGNMLNSNLPPLLEEWKIGQKIIARWFNQQPDGTFNVDVLKERGVYNADDSDLTIAEASKRGQAGLMDMGMGLVDKSYVVVIGLANLTTSDQYYDKLETKAADRKINGFRADLVSYLYKLDFTDSVAAVFFNDLWVGSQTANAASRKQAFEASNFPLVPLKSYYLPIQATQYNAGESLAPKIQKTHDELLADLVNKGIETTILRAENNVSDFRVKALVYNVNPIAVKIGKKEGLKFDQRYFAYENKMTRKGDTYSKRVGVLKSMKVVDNKSVTSGETDPSLFYQIAGNKIDNLGMFVEQKNDAGLNVFLGISNGGLPGATGRLEYYVSKFLGEVAAPGKNAKGLTSLKLYVEGGYGLDLYDLGMGFEEFTFARWSVGFNKDFYPLHFLHWGPFLGYGMETATWESEDDKISSDFIEAGVRVGINLAHNIQLLGSANYYMLLTSQKLDVNDEVKEDVYDYKVSFDDRMGPGVSVGLRIMF